MAQSKKFGFYAGHPVLDFANTVAWRLSDTPEERLESYEDVLRWFEEAKLVTPNLVATLRKDSRAAPARARRAYRTAIELRELIYRFCEALILGRRPAQRDVELFNKYLSRYVGSARLSWTREGFAWEKREISDMDGILESVVRPAAQLFASDPRTKISQCQDDRGCGWVFLDRSRSKRRRWCSMSLCGNRAKVRDHYYRT